MKEETQDMFMLDNKRRSIILLKSINLENAIEIVMRRRISFTGKAEAEFWQKEYWNISISKAADNAACKADFKS